MGWGAQMTFARLLIHFAFSIAASAALAQTQPLNSDAPAPTAKEFPSWAFLWAPSFANPPVDDGPQHVPASTTTHTWKQARDLFVAPDWHPDDHPAMPEIVASGRKPDVRACGSCHRTEGTGGPENASLAGLPPEYFIQQMLDIKSGARKLSGPERPGSIFMQAAAKAMTEVELKAAAAYFGALKPKRNITVIESETVPKTYVARLFFAKSELGGIEPLGQRIVEMPNDVVQFELRDTRTQFTAYVPKGSLARGEALATTGVAGTTVPCANCHGPDLKGVGPIPSLAGRSPTYIFRQLYEFQHGMRSGTASVLMQETVTKLTTDDMIALSGYVATLEP